MEVAYRFEVEGAEPLVVRVRLDPGTAELLDPPPDDPPGWTELGYHQCPCCPLDAESVERCPLAMRLSGVVGLFEGLVSYTRADLTVSTRERVISQQTTVQKGASSLLGLISAASGCPVTAAFRPMARFHLPLASTEETAYRACSMYMLAQYMRRCRGLEPDMGMTGLRRIYEEVHQVNTAVAERLREASRSDSALNAIVMLDAHALMVPMELDDSLMESAGLFGDYLED